MSLSTILSIVETVTIIIAAAIAIWQLREAARARSLDGFLALSEDIKRDAEARRHIYNEWGNLETDKKRTDFISGLSDEQKREIERVCVSFDRMGVLLVHRLIPRDLAFSMYFDVVLRTWNLLEPFVKEERKRLKRDAWMMYFEILNKECWKYWKKLLKKHPDWEFQKRPDDVFQYTQEIKGNVIHYPASKPCVGVFVMKDNKVLLVRRAIEPFKNYWDIPGGFLEQGEHPATGAKREIEEETGLAVEPTEILGVYMDEYGPEPESTLNICYIANVRGGKPKAGSDAKEMKWFELGKLPRKIAFKWSKEAIKDLLLRMN